MAKIERTNLQIAEKALKNKISIVLSADLAGQHFLKDTQFSLMCTSCYKQNIFNLEDLSENKVLNFNCSHIKEPGAYVDITEMIFATKENKMVWCTDKIGFFDGICQSMCDGFNKNGSGIKLSPCYSALYSTINNTSYIAFETQNSDTKTKGGIFLAELDNGDVKRGTFCCGSAAMIFLSVVNSNQSGNTVILDTLEWSLVEETVDSYINYLNAVVDRTVASTRDKLTLENFDDINKSLLSTVTTSFLNSRDRAPVNAEGIHLTYRVCPICFRYYTRTDTCCKNCGFEFKELSFINKNEADKWKSEVVFPYRERVPYIDYRGLYRAFAQSKNK